MNAATFWDPAAAFIVVGGTMLAGVLRTPLADLRRAIVAVRVLGRRRFVADALLEQIAAQARIARRHGVLTLDRSVIADPDVAAAIAAIVDGADRHTVTTLAAGSRRARAVRHAAAADAWCHLAETAPAMGMVGTLVGLAGMFATMTDAAAIGGAMAVALLATLYGALLANLVAQPIGHRLRALARAELAERERLEAPLAALAAREAPKPLGKNALASVA